MLTFFTGTWLEAVPFLVLGIVLSSFMSVFVPDGFLQKFFPRHLIPGLCFGVLGGFFLPVCDCATVPLFRTLVKKGIPLPAAVAFMTAAPVVNPVVMMSTWYAYGGNMHIVLSRTLFGMICSILTALCFTGNQHYSFADKAQRHIHEHSCLCGSGKNLSGVRNLSAVLSASKEEFMEAGSWQTVGIAIATVFQTFLKTGGLTNAFSGHANPILAILIMMALAFCLSVCSTSDAIICAAIGSGFPAVSQLAFLVFGPMLDIKNVILLSGMCSPHFAVRISITIFAICLLVMVFLSETGIRVI